MTEMQKTLKQLERTLCKFQVSGKAAILMGDALRLLLNAEAIAAEEAKAKEEAEARAVEERDE